MYDNVELLSLYYVQPNIFLYIQLGKAQRSSLAAVSSVGVKQVQERFPVLPVFKRQANSNLEAVTCSI